MLELLQARKKKATVKKNGFMCLCENIRVEKETKGEDRGVGVRVSPDLWREED